jgi:ATP-dependent DNA helicase RecQ
VPTIHYLQRREDPEHIQLPPDVYEQRQEQYRQRILAMLNYVQDNGHCRSRLLLQYFGETNTHDCGQCDVCQQQAVHSEQPAANCEQQILQLLSDGHRHHLTELHRLPLPTEAIDEALRHLLAEEHIVHDDGFISLSAH